MQYVCISLQRATERRKSMVAQMQQHDIDGRFFDAVEIQGRVEDVPGYNAAARRFFYGTPLTKGQIGCYLSHREVWKQLVASRDDAWCVMEDDIILLEGFKAATEELLVHRDAWDIVRLYGIFENPQIEFASLPSGTKMMWMDVHPLGTQCYVITRKAAERMLESTEKIQYPIDDAIDKNWKHKLRLYITSPEFVADGDFSSMIGQLESTQSIAFRVCVKPFRKLRKLAQMSFNAKNRPAGPIKLSVKKADTSGA
ncbi:glycosyl transferase family 25 [Burkholderia sp. 4701]|nr:glycosyl transferase family 25 [Burkholderia sp. 4701]MXN84800.1 glycosyl transferase family 25 [Burkholderia sp. 4812]